MTIRTKTALTAVAAAALALPLALTAQHADADSSLASYTPAKADGIAGSYIVYLKEDGRRIASAEMESVTTSEVRRAQDSGIQVVRKYEGLGGFSAKMTDAQLQKLRKNPNVESILQDRVVSLSEAETEANKNAKVVTRDLNVKSVRSWGQDRVNQPNLPLDNSYTAPGRQGAGVHAYVIDTGIYSRHQEFGDRVGNGYDSIDNDSTPQDGHGHGTHVSGTVAGASAGLAPRATIHGVRVLNDEGKGTTSQVVGGMDWVARNHISPAVANMSLGGGPSAEDDAGIRRLRAAGVVVAVAASNDTADACDYSPGREPEAFTVASSNQRDGLSWFSNYGRCVDIIAPGSDINSASNRSYNSYTENSGTSMASPHVAGALALYLGENPNATPAQAESALTRNAARGKISDPNGSPNLLLQVGFLGNGGGGPVDPIDPTTPPTTAPVDPTTAPGNPGGDTFSNTTRYSIEDYRTVSSRIRSTKANGQNVTISIDINHPCLEQLELTVVTPDGSRNVVKRASYGYYCTPWRGTKSETYQMRSKTDGSWTLEVRDVRYGSSGTLNGWQIKFS